MPKVASITAAIQAAGITPTGLKDLLLNVVAEQASPRVKVMLDGLCNLPLAEGGKIISEMLKANKPKDGEEVPAEYRTLKVRASECRQVYGAVKFSEGFREYAENNGWHSTVSEARKVLESKGLKWNGSPLTTPEERAAKAEGKAIVEILAENLIGVDTSDAERVAEIARHSAESARSKLFTDKVAAHANRIMTREGTSYGMALADALMAWTPAPEQQ